MHDIRKDNLTNAPRKRRWGSLGSRTAGAAILAGLTLIIVRSVGCGNEAATVDTAYEDPYLYDYYYPADMAYTGWYAADSWDYSAYLLDTSAIIYGPTTGTGGTTGGTTSGGAGGVGGGVVVATGGAGGSVVIADGGAGGAVATDGGAGGAGGASTNTRPLIGQVIRALIRGETVCPNQVTVTPKTAAPACAGSSATSVRNGITIVFSGCQLPAGGSLSGTFDVTSQRSASEQTCTANTVISLGHTTTITNLAYTSPSGGKIVIPSQTDTGMTTYTFGQMAPGTTISTNGELQIFSSNGTMVSDHTYNGSRTLSFQGNQSYKVDGTVNVQDQKSTASAMITGTGLTHTLACCRPVGGTLAITRTGGLRPGQHTWGFNSTCGSASFDGKTITLPACL
jgi:hypothetical protein